MIEESCVSFETGKMLKEVGFHEPCASHYSNSGEVWQSSFPEDYNDDKSCCACSRPTQSLAARWLREVHNIDVVIIPSEDGGYSYDILVRKRHIASSIPLKESYENVLEYGLFIAINLIKK